MEIKILGTGCDKCKKLHINTLEALKELKIEAQVEKLEDIVSIMSYGVMDAPALVVDGEVKLSGRVANVEEIIDIIR